MSKRIPTLGYRSRTEAAIALLKEHSVAEVAEMLETSEKNVRNLSYGSRESKPHHIKIGGIIEKALRPHAARRSMSIDDFVRYFLRTAIEAQIIDAVLDDGGRHAAKVEARAS